MLLKGDLAKSMYPRLGYTSYKKKHPAAITIKKKTATAGRDKALTKKLVNRKKESHNVQCPYNFRSRFPLRDHTSD